MTKFEKVKDIIVELQEHKGDRHIYVKQDGYCMRVTDIYVDEEGDVILSTDD